MAGIAAPLQFESLSRYTAGCVKAVYVVSVCCSQACCKTFAIPRTRVLGLLKIQKEPVPGSPARPGLAPGRLRSLWEP